MLFKFVFDIIITVGGWLMKKVYFAGSITGGRDDADTYKLIIDKLKEKFIVLTEHVGAENLSQMGEYNLSDEYIYTRDVAWIRECDIVFAEVTQLSLGVGYEIGYAEAHGKKILCFVNGGKVNRLSAMLTGNKNVECHTYIDIQEIYDFIDNMEA